MLGVVTATSQSQAGAAVRRRCELWTVRSVPDLAVMIARRLSHETRQLPCNSCSETGSCVVDGIEDAQLTLTRNAVTAAAAIRTRAKLTART
jgi:hypothetical protein